MSDRPIARTRWLHPSSYLSIYVTTDFCAWFVRDSFPASTLPSPASVRLATIPHPSLRPIRAPPETRGEHMGLRSHHKAKGEKTAFRNVRDADLTGSNAPTSAVVRNPEFYHEVIIIIIFHAQRFTTAARSTIYGRDHLLYNTYDISFGMRCKHEIILYNSHHCRGMIPKEVFQSFHILSTE